MDIILLDIILVIHTTQRPEMETREDHNHLIDPHDTFLRSCSFFLSSTLYALCVLCLVMKSMVEVELCEGGANKKVDNDNKASFVQLAAQRRMIRGADDEIKAMAKVRRRREREEEEKEGGRGAR
jgi:hypothetical protein